MDVNSLYTNIDYDEGADACYRNLETHKNKTLPSSTFKNCILLSLKSNIFQFCNTFHIQKMGTTIGTAMPANYANLFMDMFETSHLNDFHKKTGKKTFIMAAFYRRHIFPLNRGWRIVEGIFSIFPEIQWHKEYEVSHKIWNHNLPKLSTS